MSSKQCQHCGSRFQPGQGQGEFCCAGCEHVYRLIQSGGLGEYYSQQDRVGQPVGDRPFAGYNHVWVQQLQQRAEQQGDGVLTVAITGMSCMGCAWLVEQLSRRQPGVLSAKVALESSVLRLQWKCGAFDLGALAADLQKFGYGLSDEASAAGGALSPLSMRLVLSSVFSLNGLLLAMAAGLGVGGEGLGQIYILLLLLCLLLTLLIGGSLFIKPAWGALQLRRFHSDMLPSLTLVALCVSSLLALLLAGPWLIFLVSYFSLLPVLVFARWVSDMRERR